MARQISKAVVDAGRPARYPWAKWANGKWWEVVHGEDFQAPPHNFRTQVYSHARYHGKQAEVTVAGNKVRFRIFEKETT